MGLAIELFFDTETEDAVRETWKWLARNEGLPFLHESGSTPHISLAVFDDGDVKTQAAAICDLAKTTRAFPVTLTRVGAFEDVGVLFVAPDASEELSALHARFWMSYPEFGSQPWIHYFPSRWTPHCTLALELRDRSSPWLRRVRSQMAARLDLPRTAQVCRIALVEFRPSKILIECPLVG